MKVPDEIRTMASRSGPSSSLSWVPSYLGFLSSVHLSLVVSSPLSRLVAHPQPASSLSSLHLSPLESIAQNSELSEEFIRLNCRHTTSNNCHHLIVFSCRSESS